MRLLLDTHAFLWFVGGNPRLSSAARSAIEDLVNVRLLSAASVWEIAIKVSLGKLSLNVPFGDLFPGQLWSSAIELLPVRPEHAAAIIELPFHHRDPFDRMIVAQTQAEGAILVSADPTLDAYGVQRLW